MDSFCEYCGGNDEIPISHCRDCDRPIKASDVFDVVECLERIVQTNGVVSKKTLKEAKSALSRWRKIP